MRIRIAPRRTKCIGDRWYSAGDVLDVEEVVGQGLVETGAAVEVGERKPKKKTTKSEEE